MKSFSGNIPIFAFSQAMAMSGGSLIVATAALVGFELADDKSLSTIPFALQYLAVLLTSVPAAMLMKRIGHKASFILATFLGMAGAGLSGWSIMQHSFSGFIGGVMLIGVYIGFTNYYRFSAADGVKTDEKSKAIGFVLAGGVVAAVIGPNLAGYTQHSIAGAAFAGGYFSLVGLYFLSAVSLSFLRLPKMKTQSNNHPLQRSLRQILRQPVFIVALICGMLGYAVMSFIMTATPLAMKHHTHGFADTSFVIQWHVLAMFAPSFISGVLIEKAGEIKIMLIGSALAVVCVMINLLGTGIIHFWLALVLLGISWNFLYVGATSLLTQTYNGAERFKVQAVNDFIIFTTVALASLFAGYLQHNLGWKAVNAGVLPLLVVISSSLVFLYYYKRRRGEPVKGRAVTET